MASVRSVWPLFVAAFLATFQLSLANISVPDIQRHLGASPAELALVVGGFAAAFAAGLVTCGHLGDRYGRRRLFLIGLAAVTVAAVGAALAPNIGWLLAGRVVQGLASAIMMPQILATVQAVLVGPERARGVALFAAFGGVGTVAGQLVGGAVISLLPEGLGWRGAQLTGAVVAFAALLGGRRLPPSHSDTPARVDPAGSVLLGVGLLTLVTALSLGPSSGWAGWDLGILLLAVVLIAALVAHQRWAARNGHPAVLPADVLALPPVRTGAVMALLFFGGFGAFMYNFSVLTQRGLGLSPLASGVATGPFAIAFVVTSVCSTRLVARLGPKTMMLGAGLQVVGLLVVAALSLTDVPGWVWWFQPVGLLLGVAQAWMFGPMVQTVMQAIPDRVAGLTGGLIATAQQAGLGIGVAVIGGLFGTLSQSMAMPVAFGALAVGQAGLGLVFGALAWRLARAAAKRSTPVQQPAERVEASAP